MLIYYDNFIAEIGYISRTGCFYGEVINHNCFIVFQAEAKNNLVEVFKIAVEQYLNYIKPYQQSHTLNIENDCLNTETLV